MPHAHPRNLAAHAHPARKQRKDMDPATNQGVSGAQIRYCQVGGYPIGTLLLRNPSSQAATGLLQKTGPGAVALPISHDQHEALAGCVVGEFGLPS